MVSRAPNIRRTGSAVVIRKTVSMIDVTTVRMIPWPATLSQCALSPLPMLLDIADDIPIPRPVPAPTNAVYIGATIPIAANSLEPSPDTHSVSMKLFACCIRNARHSGMANATTPLR